MLPYVIYKQSGEIVRMAKGPAESAEIGLGSDEFIYWGEIDPKTQYLPGGVPTLRPAPLSTATVKQVKEWAARLLSYSDWRVTRSQETGEPMPQIWLDYRQAVRDRSGVIETMKPIPDDYRDMKHWPKAPQ